MISASTTATGDVAPDFDAFNTSCQYNLAAVVKANGPELFTVELDNLNAIYLANLPPDQRQSHTCNCCRRFIERFGGLVSINPDGSLRSAIWNPETAPEGYQLAAEAMALMVERSKVTGVFYWDDVEWGTAEAGGFTHFYVTGPMPEARRTSTAYQRAAAKREDMRTLRHALREFPRPLVLEAINLLEGDALTRAEKVIGPARFLLSAHDIKSQSPRFESNLMWLAVAKAPAGFCTPRSSMIGTLLDDLRAGKPIEQIKRSFAEKMRGDRYQRPQAAPAAGNIAQAEKLVAQMGIEPALHRRYARIEEVKLLWSPAAPKPHASSGGVFGHLDTKRAPARTAGHITGQTMTWAKFRATVLPKASKIEFFLRSSRSFAGFLTAVNPDAPPILQWDRAEQRNPFSHYVYTGGSSPHDWGLSGDLVEVTGVMLKAHMWADEEAYPHQQKGAVFILNGAQDQRAAHLCLFPETLISDLHAVRSTIERHSQSRKAEGQFDGTANGVIFADKSTVQLRVTTDTGASDITLDRWF